MRKYCKNLKYGIMPFCIAILFFTLTLCLCISIDNSYFYFFLTLLLLSLLYFAIVLFFEPLSLFFFISFNESGFKIYFCKKLLKSYDWKEVKKIQCRHSFYEGKIFEIVLNNGKTINVSKSKNIEEEITKYFQIN